MADTGTGGDKTEKASAQKLRKAREEGQVVRSKDLATAVGIPVELGHPLQFVRLDKKLGLNPQQLAEAEPHMAVPVGLATPVVRSFVALPAGVAGMPFRRFLPLAFLGCVPFCFGLAGGGWALVPHKLVGGLELPNEGVLGRYGRTLRKSIRFYRTARGELRHRKARPGR